MAKKKDVVPYLLTMWKRWKRRCRRCARRRKIFATYTQEQVDKIFLCGSSCSEQNAYSTCKAGS